MKADRFAIIEREAKDMDRQLGLPKGNPQFDSFFEAAVFMTLRLIAIILIEMARPDEEV